MHKWLSILGVLAVSFFIFPSVVFAQTLQLNTIGAMDVSSVSYDHWWYTNSNVTFAGTAGANATVSVVAGATTGSATADASGNWSYAATLAEGADHAMSFSSGGSTVAFTLTIGPLPADVGTTTATSSAMPVAGVSWPTIGMLVFGLVLIASGVLLRRAYQV